MGQPSQNKGTLHRADKYRDPVLAHRRRSPVVGPRSVILCPATRATARLRRPRRWFGLARDPGVFSLDASTTFVGISVSEARHSWTGRYQNRKLRTAKWGPTVNLRCENSPARMAAMGHLRCNRPCPLRRNLGYLLAASSAVTLLLIVCFIVCEAH
jgi:hypothetical protein